MDVNKAIAHCKSFSLGGGGQLQNAGPLRTTCFTCVKIFSRMKHNTIRTFVIKVAP